MRVVGTSIVGVLLGISMAWAGPLHDAVRDGNR